MFDEDFFFWLDLVAKKFQIFGIDPGAHIAVSDNHRTSIGENAVTGHVVDVVVGVDDKFEGEVRDGLYFGEKGLGSSFVLKRVDDYNAAVADDESRIRTRVAI